MLSSGKACCDMCQSYLRYHHGSRSKVELSRVMATAQTASPLIDRVAAYATLKRFGIGRVASSSLEEFAQRAAQQKDIASRIASKLGFVGRDSDSGGMTGCLLSLPAYIRKFGNPLANGHAIVPTIGDDGGFSVCVRAPPSSQEQGRFELAGAVAQAWGDSSPLPPAVLRLCAHRVDDLGLVRVVRQVVEEYRLRHELMKSVETTEQLPAMSAAQSSCGSGGAKRSGTSHAHDSVANCLRDGALVKEPACKRARARCRPSPSPRRVKADAERSRSRSAASSDVPPRRRGGASNVAATSISGGTSLDKAFRKLQIRMAALLVVFSPEKWPAMLKHKAKACEKIQEAMDELTKRCTHASREDIIEDIEEHREVVQAMDKLVDLAKKAPVEDRNEIKLALVVVSVQWFLDLPIREGLVGREASLAPSLMKLQVV